MKIKKDDAYERNPCCMKQESCPELQVIVLGGTTNFRHRVPGVTLETEPNLDRSDGASGG